MNEFSAQLYRKREPSIVTREDAPSNPVPSLHNRSLYSGSGEIQRRDQPADSAAQYDNVAFLHKPVFFDLRFVIQL